MRLQIFEGRRDVYFLQDRGGGFDYTTCPEVSVVSSLAPTLRDLQKYSQKKIVYKRGFRYPSKYISDCAVR